MDSLEVSEGKKNKMDATSTPAADPIIGMNLSSSQTELVQSWGLGHSGQISVKVTHNVRKYLEPTERNRSIPRITGYRSTPAEGRGPDGVVHCTTYII
jgi:hypothetical protein